MIIFHIEKERHDNQMQREAEESFAQQADWQAEIRDMVRTPKALFDALSLPEHLLPDAEAAHHIFPVRATRHYLQQIEPGNPDDPLLRQILPLAGELAHRENYVDDPLAERQATVAPGILHKYQNRVLLVNTQACAIHCRYCFRRNFDYSSQRSPNAQTLVLDYLRRHPEIEEVILSGGDPLMLDNHRLIALLEALQGVHSLRALRIHTRLPVVLPNRVNDALLKGLAQIRLPVTVVVHCNHPHEIDPRVKRALLRLSQGSQVLNQSVLLSQVNDQAEVLAELSWRLLECRTRPYYLHLPDRVSGTAHFTVSRQRALDLHADLATRLPGHLLPHLVEEIPGEPGKTRLA